MVRIIHLLGVLLIVGLAPAVGLAADTELEEALQRNLQESGNLLARIRTELGSPERISADLSSLKSVAEEIRISDLLLRERFALREERLQNLGSKVEERHRAMTEGYRKTLQDYLNLVEALPTGEAISLTVLENLQTLLDQILPKKRRPILGSLPYRNLQYSLKDPNADPPITPAYLGGNTSVVPEDLKDPSSKAVSALAQSLNWNPVSIYEWVKNSVETEWYFGCMKGAEETLRQKSGNDCDQATLLAALLRASGYPSRYLRGVIEFFPDLTQAKNLTGIDDERELASFFQKAGIPFRPIIAGGKISNLQIEHIWVESRIPYSNYRGAVLDEEGKSWIALDTSIKAAGYDSNLPADLPPEPFFSEIRDQYLGALRTETPLEFIQSKLEAYLSLNQPGKGYADLLRRRTLLPEVLNILPANLQFRPINITHEYAEIPEGLFHRVKMIASRCGLRVASCGAEQTLFDITLAAAQFSNQKVVLTYEPESVEDQQTIDAYGGLDNTPAYLVRLRPVIKVNEERIVVAKDGLPMGEPYALTVEMISPSGVETFTTHPIIGNLSVLGIVSQKAVLDPQPETRNAQPEASQLLYEEAQRYADRWNQAEDELASLMRLSISRPIPSLVLVGGMINVTYLLDTPHGFEWKGVFVDAGLRAVESGSVGALESGSVGELERERVRAFMQLSSLQGSILENRIFEDDFKVESISTAKLFTLLGTLPLSHPPTLLTLTPSNSPTFLPTLPFPQEIKEDITNAVNRGWVVRIPSSEIAYRDWRGIGYLKEDPETGEAGWMLSGEIAGGNSVDDPSNWDEQQFAHRLSRPYSGEVNMNPMAATSILKVKITDQQRGTVAGGLTHPLGVYVRDRNMKPVAGALVTFQIVAGGGKIRNPVSSEMVDTFAVLTDESGIATAALFLGRKTSDNPVYMKLDAADLYMTQVGLNLVTATVESNAGTIPLDAPFVAYAKPDVPRKLLKAFPKEGKTVTALVNNPAGSVRVIVADEDDNPISNVDVIFNALAAAPDPVPSDPLRNIQFYKPDDCPNPYPLFGDCPTAETLTIKTQYFGAMVNTVLGNTVNTTYQVQAVTANIAPVTFTFYSDGLRVPGTYIEPSLYLRSLEIVDDNGNPVNAAKVGTRLKAPLVSKLFELWDAYTMEGGSVCPSSGEPNCWRIKASGLVNVTPIPDGTVDYQRVLPTVSQAGEIPAENLGDGRYQAIYTTANDPAKNNIEAVGSATLTVPVVYYNPLTRYADTEGYPTNVLSTASVSLQSGQSVLFDRHAQTQIIRGSVQKALYSVYGVDIQLAIDPLVIVLSDAGQTTRNVTFRYTILPGEYEPNLAMIELYRGPSRPINPGEGWYGYILGDKGVPVVMGGETRRQGSAILAAGSPFDISLFYTAEVTLNRGTPTEIRSGKEVVSGGTTTVQRTDVPIAKILVKSDVMGTGSSSVDQIRFGNGTQGAKIYRIELQSKVLFESCDDLLGMLHAITKDGAPVKPPDDPQNDHFPRASYPLNFKVDNGQCRVKVDDSALTSSNPKDRFILSNLSLGALGSTDKAVLYGGIGNQVEIDINGAKKDIPVEPIGVIVIGIDGLRQDVLYPDALDKVQENGRYRVDIELLTGIKEILAGYDPIDETKQRYIMVPEVTAIFPSITLASWASIFTGVQAGQHGILGNEFFDRSTQRLYTFSDGAFPMMSMLDRYPIPNRSHLSGGGQADQLLGSRQNGVQTVYEGIKAIQPDLRAATFLHNYSRGADEWFYFESLIDQLRLFWNARIQHDEADVARLLDSSPTDDSVNYINGLASEGREFPALLSVYLPGLDHWAHDEGMGTYTQFFKESTDVNVGKIARALKDAGEFDNKIFLITADHGMTAMPEFGRVTLYPGTSDERTVTPNTSCELTLDDFSKREVQDAEITNNNLHIWELAEVFKVVGESTPFQYKVLASEQIAALFRDKNQQELPYSATSDINKANLVAALNGPMAHLYLKSGSGWGSLPSDAEIGRVALVFKRFFQESGGGLDVDLRNQFSRLLASVDYILIRIGNEYRIFNGFDQNGQLIPPSPISLDTLKYIKANERIQGMNHSKRSGDIVLIMKEDVNDVNQRFTTGVACKSWHGSLNRNDSYVPLIVAYPGGNKTVLEGIINQATICPGGLCEGNWKANDIVLEFIRRQYH